MQKNVVDYIKKVNRFESIILVLVFVSWMYSFIIFYDIRPFSFVWTLYMLILAIVLVLLFRIRGEMKESERQLM